jgi:pentatricopeptide repeat domain-containing protein 1
MTVLELKSALAKRQLPVDGQKAVLVARLEEHERNASPHDSIGYDTAVQTLLERLKQSNQARQNERPHGGNVHHATAINRPGPVATNLKPTESRSGKKMSKARRDLEAAREKRLGPDTSPPAVTVPTKRPQAYEASVPSTQQTGTNKHTIAAIRALRQPRLSDIRNILTKNGRPSPTAVDAAITLLQEQRMSAEAVALFREVTAWGIVPKTATQNTVLVACAATFNPMFDDAFAILDEMERLGMTVKVDAYNNLLVACARAWELDFAFDLFQDMQRMGVNPNGYTYSAMIKVCNVFVRVDKAMHVFQILKSDTSITASEVLILFSAIISVCGKGKHFQEASQVFEEMRRLDVKPNNITFNAMISACEKCGQVDKAMEYFSEMKSEGVEPDVVTFNALISTCEKAKTLETAFSIFWDMKRHPHLAPDLITYNAMLSTCEKVGAADSAVALFHEMKDMGVRPDVITFTALIRACERGHFIQGALDAFHEMQWSNIAADSVTYNALLSVCEQSGRGDEALSLFADMKTAGITPDMISFIKVIECLEGQGRHEEAKGVFHEARLRGYFTKASNFDLNNGKIDLHDLRVGPAKIAVRYSLDTHASGLGTDSVRSQSLIVVTGQGNHTDGKSKVKDAIIGMLSTPDFKALGAKEHATNPGRILISPECFLRWNHSRCPDYIPCRSLEQKNIGRVSNFVQYHKYFYGVVP